MRFLDLLLDTISEFPRVFVILDAFDETKKEERGKIIEYLTRVCTSKFSLFITTRSPLADSMLKKSFPASKMLEITARDEDVDQYLTEKLHREESLHPMLKQHISDTLKAGAHGKYVYVLSHS
jgi:hypothetical protein